jgi:hypothetical protein
MLSEIQSGVSGEDCGIRLSTGQSGTPPPALQGQGLLRGFDIWMRSPKLVRDLKDPSGFIASS